MSGIFMQRVLGFDFGLRCIGVAFGQMITHTAKPLTVLPAQKGEPNWQQIQSLILEWRPQLLLVGLPLNMDGTEQPLTQLARSFADKLQRVCLLPVELVDERLSTREAKSRVFEQGGYRALQKQRMDAIAATLIVETWINSHAQ